MRPKIDEVEGLQFLPPSCVSSSIARWGHSRRLAASCGSIQSGNCWPRRRGGRLQPPIIPTSLFTNSIQTKRVYSGLDSTFSAAETLTQSAPPFFDSKISLRAPTAQPWSGSTKCTRASPAGALSLRQLRPDSSVRQRPLVVTSQPRLSLRKNRDWPGSLRGTSDQCAPPSLVRADMGLTERPSKIAPTAIPRLTEGNFRSEMTKVACS